MKNERKSITDHSRRVFLMHTLFVAVALMLPCITTSVRAEENKSSDMSEFESFRIVVDRNIFDPNRSPHQLNSRSVSNDPVSQPERLALLGAMVYGEEAVAFFEGTKPEYTANVNEGDTIAGYRIVEIRTDGLKLSKGERHIELPVGSVLSRQRGSEWELSLSAGRFNRSGLTSHSRESEQQGLSRGQAPSRDESSGSSYTDLLKRLKERRKRELGQ